MSSPQATHDAVRYLPMTGPEHRDAVLDMMRGLYEEDPASEPVDTSRFGLTIDLVLDHPGRAHLVVFMAGSQPVGYGLVMPYWSNEFGGWIAFIDELFVRPAHRGRGISTRFIQHLAEHPPFQARLLMLEVTAGNDRARKLYASLGFKERTNRTMARPLAAR